MGKKVRLTTRTADGYRSTHYVSALNAVCMHMHIMSAVSEFHYQRFTTNTYRGPTYFDSRNRVDYFSSYCRV